MDPVFAALNVDVARTRASLPAGLKGLADVVWNVVWTWLPGAPALFREIDAGLWAASNHNARAVLERADPRRLAELAADPAYLERVSMLEAALREYLARPVATAA